MADELSQRLISTGIYQMWRDRSVMERASKEYLQMRAEQKQSGRVSKGVKLGVWQLAVTFVLLVAGLAISAFAFATEVLIVTRKKQDGFE